MNDQTTTRRVRWQRDGNRISISVRTSDGAVSVVTLPYDAWDEAVSTPETGAVEEPDSEGGGR